MARQARQESETGYYHVMMCGINREFIFREDTNKACFMELVKEQQANGLLELLAWCVMDNHVHMILKAEKVAMSKAIKIISLKFAAHYNRGQKRTGPVFGDRFRSEIIENDTYLLGTLRYIHRNPVKAKLANDMATYRWSSFGEYLGLLQYVAAGQKAFVLELFCGGLKSFVSFHAQEDDVEYLEIREEAEQNRETLAFAVIESFCRENGVTYAKEIQGSPELFREICRRLVQDSGLSLRKTAEYLSTTHHRVHEALQD
ncbi:MAG: transposase [Peptococcaceae bacterium]|nr:transposase [Peptococcaceae bacterium]